MSSSGEKSKRYYVSKNFYHYVKPGDVRINATVNDTTSHIYSLAFKNDTAHTTTIVLINDNATDKAVQISGASLPSAFEKFTTSQNEDCKDDGAINNTDIFTIPANSVITLYKKN